MLTVSGAIIFAFTNISLKLKFRYPVVDCNDIDSDFGVSKDGKTASRAIEYQDEAIQEYNANVDFEKEGKTTHFQGKMQCFCGWEARKGVDVKKKYSFISQKLQNKDDKPIDMCNKYSNDKLRSLALGQTVAFVIIAVNVILRIVIIKGVTWVGEDTHS